jgi:hypothetical protein
VEECSKIDKIERRDAAFGVGRWAMLTYLEYSISVSFEMLLYCTIPSASHSVDMIEVRAGCEITSRRHPIHHVLVPEN